MANIRKTFNFRNGIQVDEDNLLVNSLGLVGIGTTVPTELLDVRGTVKVVGLLTATEVNVIQANITGIATANRLNAGGISLNSGIITATSGIVTYYGDGVNLLNLPTSQWRDVDVGLGFTSIYAAGFVGVGTVDPRFLFQVGGNNNIGSFSNGVGINSSGDIVATGNISADGNISVDGNATIGGNVNVTGNVIASTLSGIGSNLTNLNAANISSGTLDADRLPVVPNSKIPNFFQVAGIITAQGGFVGNLTGNVIGIATTARDLTADARINISSVNTSSLISGVSTISTKLEVNGLVGINTINPQSDLHLIKSGISSIQITSDGVSILTLGRSLDQKQNAGGLQFGNTIGLYEYSSSRSLDIINYDLGNLNTYIHLGPSGVGTGSFNWIYGQNPTNPIMSLTYDGKLGVGATQPTSTLHVVGTSTVTNNAFFGQNVSISGNLVVDGIITVPGPLNVNVIGDLTGNVNSSGVSTFFNIGVSSITASEISAFGATIPNLSSTIIDASAVVASSSVGIGTSFGGLRSAIDFADAGKGLFGGAISQMIVPRLTTTERGSLSPQSGGIIFNVTTSKFQGYTGIGWTDLN